VRRGVYTYEIAETKVATVEAHGQGAEFPFLSYDGTGMSCRSPRSWSLPLRLAFAEAKARRHEHVTLEHLLYALLRDPNRDADPPRLPERGCRS